MENGYMLIFVGVTLIFFSGFFIGNNITKNDIKDICQTNITKNLLLDDCKKVVYDSNYKFDFDINNLSIDDREYVNKMEREGYSVTINDYCDDWDGLMINRVAIRVG